MFPDERCTCCTHCLHCYTTTTIRDFLIRSPQKKLTASLQKNSRPGQIRSHGMMSGWPAKNQSSPRLCACRHPRSWSAVVQSFLSSSFVSLGEHPATPRSLCGRKVGLDVDSLTTCERSSCILTLSTDDTALTTYTCVSGSVMDWTCTTPQAQKKIRGS